MFSRPRKVTHSVLITFHYFGRLYDLPHDVAALARRRQLVHHHSRIAHLTHTKASDSVSNSRLSSPIKATVTNRLGQEPSRPSPNRRSKSETCRAFCSSVLPVRRSPRRLASSVHRSYRLRLIRLHRRHCPRTTHPTPQVVRLRNHYPSSLCRKGQGV